MFVVLCVIASVALLAIALVKRHNKSGFEYKLQLCTGPAHQYHKGVSAATSQYDSGALTETNYPPRRKTWPTDNQLMKAPAPGECGTARGLIPCGPRGPSWEAVTVNSWPGG